MPTNAGDACAVAEIPDPATAAGSNGQTLATRPTPPAQTPAPKSQIDPAPQPVPPQEPRSAPPRANIPGYRVEKELGRGGMGTVYLARQLSLDRPVALKLMAKRYAADPKFVARFTREAFAAARLSHPNIVQIHDIGEADGARFFSMEYVPGRSLSDLVAERGKLDPETAVGYVLQAARGLRHAHDRGMVHRDVKPDNLLLDEQGLVKVADLGLVKVHGSDTPAASSGPASSRPDLTGFRMALGTPAYMSPEQCRDATTVDHRADIYSLGCTLYVLLTGRPPFEGTTAVEVMSKHAYEPLVPPERIVARVPPELSSVILRMMAKDAADRFPDMGEVVRTLEDWLGVRSSAGGFVPREEQITRLEGFAHAFLTAPAAVLRGRVVAGGVAGTVALAALLLFFGKLLWAFALVAGLAQFGLACFVMNGVSARGPVFTRVRQFLAGLGWADRGIVAAGAGLFLLLLAMSGALWYAAGAGVVGLALALVVRRRFDRRADEQRAVSLRGSERLVRQLRANGLDEDEVRLFVARFAGRYWEEFFEALFGYESKLLTRAVLLRGGSAGRREKFAPWREPLLALIDRVERARREARDRRLLEAVERERLQAEGVSRAEAERQAAVAAAAIVRRVEAVRRVEPAPGLPAADFDFAPTSPSLFTRVVGWCVGPAVRAVGAAVLLAGCGLWAHQNGLLPGMEAGRRAVAAVEAQDLETLHEVASVAGKAAAAPLVVDGLPAGLTAWADSWNVGLAGLLLLGSLCFRGNLMGLLVLAGAGLVVAGHHLGIQTVEPLREAHVGLMLGSVVAFVGFRTGSR
ncbi:MAG: serine/threonine-protein kinase [Gemmataceae bacterium]